MARKGWDALSGPYRARLLRQGITQSEYESGTAQLHKARGHRSSADESFTKRIRRFIGTYDVSEDPKTEFAHIKAMGPDRAKHYMDYRRKMTRLYEGGDFEKAQGMYYRRDHQISGVVFYRTRSGNVVDGTWFYHGMFGG